MKTFLNLKLSDFFKSNFQKRLIEPHDKLFESLVGLKHLKLSLKNAPVNNALDLTKELLSESNIAIDFKRSDLERIPLNEPIIIIANHPFGVLDGIIAIHLLSKRLLNFKIIVNNLLMHLPYVKHYFIGIDAYSYKSIKNISPLKKAVAHLKENRVLMLFPAGEVSSWQWKKAKVTDSPWQKSVLTLAELSGAKIVPMYISGKNSFSFYFFGLFHPIFKSVQLVHEFLNKKNLKVKVRFGQSITCKELDSVGDSKQKLAYLRLRTYALQVNDDDAKKNEDFKELKPIIDEIPAQTLKTEVNALSKHHLLLSQSGFNVYYAKAHQIPNLLLEIGRQRELSFREVGEGSGNAFDLDKFDQHYIHLFIWNTEENEIVGAYRMAETEKIVKQFGLNSLYTSTLFHYNKSFLKDMGPSLELGRAFIGAKYQKKYLSLLLLWKGICAFIVRNPQIKTLFGPVSISQDYSEKSRSLMVHALQKKRLFVNARTPLKKGLERDLKEYISSYKIQSIDDLSCLVKALEHDNKDIPILLKQYLKLGGLIYSFNVDKTFKDALDGLIVVDLSKAPRKTLALYMGEDIERYLDYHEPYLINTNPDLVAI